MVKPDHNQVVGSSVSDRVDTVGAYIILIFLGYALVFGIVFLWLAISGANAWYAVYIPLIAFPGILLAPVSLAWRKRKSV